MVEMDVALELEDDVFFADLSQRISLLIMDDDGDEAALWPQHPSIYFQGLPHASRPVAPSMSTFYEQACRREMRGTGVFIPQCSLPRRKQRAAGRSRHAGKPKAQASAATMAATTTKNSNRGSSRQQQAEVV